MHNKNIKRVVTRLITMCGCSMLVVLPAIANNAMPDDLTSLSLEQLMNIEVTSVAKKPQKKSEAAAAIYVLTSDDLRRLGVTEIPEALRHVPGLQVARIDSNKWAVSSRGFNGRFSNKLLVLIDGRSIYTPLFAGVYWEALHVPMDDIERIEVIRGPGGSLWGANAVNGVINIITKRAADTTGGLITGGIGDELRGIGSVRYGAEFGETGHYRVYASTHSHEVSFNPDGAHDDWESAQAGFRVDWTSGTGDELTLQGDVLEGDVGHQVTTPVAVGDAFNAPANLSIFSEDVELSSHNMMLRWTRTLSQGSSFSLQMYYDHFERVGATLFEDRNTYDIDFQHRFAWRDSHDLIWGLGYRLITDETRATELFSLSPSNRDTDLFSAFVQDEIRVLDDRLAITVGAKFELNDFTGFEIQPNIRAAWMPDDRQTYWGAISRAVRTPSRGEHDVRLRVLPQGAPPTTAVYVTGSDQFESEELLAFEFGYRARLSDKWSIDLAGFYNNYDQLRTFDAVSPPPTIVLPFANQMDGTAAGGELALDWAPTPDWRMRASYSFLTVDLDLDATSTSSAILAEENSPKHQTMVWTSVDVTATIQVDAMLRYVDDIKVNGFPIDAYTELDLRLGWQLQPELEVSLVGRNLLDSQHAEFSPTFIGTQMTETEQEFYVLAKWNF